MNLLLYVYIMVNIFTPQALRPLSNCVLFTYCLRGVVVAIGTWWLAWLHRKFPSLVPYDSLRGGLGSWQNLLGGFSEWTGFHISSSLSLLPPTGEPWNPLPSQFEKPPSLQENVTFVRWGGVRWGQEKVLSWTLLLQPKQRWLSKYVKMDLTPMALEMRWDSQGPSPRRFRYWNTKMTRLQGYFNLKKKWIDLMPILNSLW